MIYCRSSEYFSNFLINNCLFSIKIFPISISLHNRNDSGRIDGNDLLQNDVCLLIQLNSVVIVLKRDSIECPAVSGG